MPELPEVETVRDGLARHIVGKRITAAKVFRDYSVRRHMGGPADFESQLPGLTVSYAARRGKFLWLGFDDSDVALAGHLGMSGQLLVKSRELNPQGTLEDPELGKHCRVRIHLASGTSSEPDTVLDFVDQRTFGYLAVADLHATADNLPAGWGSEEARIPYLVNHIARDLLDPAVAPGTPGRELLNKKIRSKTGAIKKVILDQEIVSGVGNIYADEALWRAKIHGERSAIKLTRAQVAVLLDAAQEVMTSALAQGGTSFDALYVNVNGESGYFDRSLNAYGQENQPCGRCGTEIRRSSFMNRSSYWCPKCQPKPRGN